MPEDNKLAMPGLEKVGEPENKIEKPEISENIQENLGTPEIKKKRESVVAEIEKEDGKGLEKTGEGAFSGKRKSSAGKNYQTRQKQIEKVLEADLKDIYLGMPPGKQNEFKILGEQTAGKINQLLEKGKFRVGQIIDLIKKWLQTIPGVNKFFLDQEAKIKSDAIMKIRDESDNIE